VPAPDGKQFIHLLDEGGRKRAYEALYHGTTVELNVGDIIDPAKFARPGRNLAFSTPSLSAAKRFAGVQSPRVPKVPQISDDGQMVRDETPGFVYQVEPVDTEDLDSTWAREMKYFKPRTTEVVSNKGFRVVKIIHPRSK
jgi:hypothetical protein